MAKYQHNSRTSQPAQAGVYAVICYHVSNCELRYSRFDGEFWHLPCPTPQEAARVGHASPVTVDVVMWGNLS